MEVWNYSETFINFMEIELENWFKMAEEGMEDIG